MLPVFIIGAIVLAGILAFIVISHLPFFRMTSRTTGEVIACEEREVIPTTSPKTFQTHVTFRFLAGKRPVEFSRTFPGARAGIFTVGRKFEVWYSPATPTESRVVTPDLG
jgi:hypothetical protein